MATLDCTRIRGLVTNPRTNKLLSSLTVRSVAKKLGCPIVNGRYVTDDRWRLAESSYYCWRMARFHGGADVTMPVIAGLMVHGHDKAEVELLDQLADALAVESFGTSMAAALRWGRALGL